MDLPERSASRDAALMALLPRVEALGWTGAALRAALADIGADPDDAPLLFAGGAAELIEGWCDLADRQMAAAADFGALKLSARVRGLVALRLAQNRPHKAAIGRALGLMARPGHAGLAARCTARTVDAIWHEAGDASADFAWYTKRASLAAIYGATLLYWLRDAGEDDTATLAFFDRRLADLGRLGRLRGRLTGTRHRRGGAAAA